ncbi:MAG: sensor histidine kinase [Chloroflexi bacterium]|nr:sensor histidine kinase [Chloroflexota bacterium]
MSERLIAVLEAERGKIAREIHDEAGQLLISATFLLDQAMAMLPRAFVARDLVAQARQTLDECTEELHRLAFDLRPRILDDLGLLPALRSYLKNHAKLGSVALKVELEPPLRKMDSAIELAIFRVVQEALANVRKHAKATTVRVHLHFTTEYAELWVEDDGVGFDPRAVKPGEIRPKMGVVGMRERATALGGALEVESSPSAGTTIHAKLPIREVKDDQKN